MNSRAVIRSGFCAESAIRKPQIAEEKKVAMDGNKSADERTAGFYASAVIPKPR